MAGVWFSYEKAIRNLPCSSYFLYSCNYLGHHMITIVQILCNRFLLTFMLGFVFSVCLIVLRDYRTDPITNRSVKVFSILPYEPFIDEKESLDLTVRSPDFEPSYSTEFAHECLERTLYAGVFAKNQEVSVTVNTGLIGAQSSLDLEALSSMHAAIEMFQQGKLDKAMKLFEHALALAPRHPDVLNHYGEFLESTKNDIISADQLYFKALTYSPEHEGANTNRGRLAALVEEMDRRELRRIDKKRDMVAGIPDSNAALRRAKREAYYQHIYHTAGIEGNSMTLSQTRSIVETRMAIGGKSIAEHNEILGLDAALKYINTTLINRIGGLTLEDILEIHRRVLGFVDPVEGGSFRRTQVFVGAHIPPSPVNIPPLMKQFETWINSWSALALHPIRYAALAHYKLVHIHPFHDGNGRTSRLLMNTILMQAGYPPVIILKQDRHRYYKMLELANEGDVRPFVRFIAECTERTLDLFLWSTSEYSSVPKLEPASHTIPIKD